MQTVFETFCQAEFDRDWAWVRDTYGEEANSAHLPRTASQRRADGFVAMVLAAAEAGTGEGRSIDTTVNLVLDLDQFEQHAVAEIIEDDSNTAVDPSSVLDRRCETTDGNPVDPRQMVAAAFLGRLRLIVVDGRGVIVHAGRKRRLFNGALREAIQAIDPVCSWLGCNLRAQICDIDHLEPRSRGGPTNPGNSGIMCHKHNVFKHTAGYTATRNTNGKVAITRPTARVSKHPTLPDGGRGPRTELFSRALRFLGRSPTPARARTERWGNTLRQRRGRHRRDRHPAPRLPTATRSHLPARGAQAST